ncbi:MAG: hypothetical protein AAGE83_15770 [Pseudomonadota bacterium]
MSARPILAISCTAVLRQRVYAIIGKGGLTGIGALSVSLLSPKDG